MKGKTLLSTIFLSVLLILAACGNSDNNNQPTEPTTSGNDEPTEESASGSIVISGSSAMQPLVASAAEQFMNENPNADIQVNAGGSGQGLSDISQGNVDIGNSDVFAEEKEIENVDELVDYKIAVVGMAAAVHPDVGITNISKEDLIKVFTGEITNWKELGGVDEVITLVNRPDSSGTRATFVKYGLDGAEPAEGITEDSSNTVKKIISETPGAIGYLAFSYLQDDVVTPLSIDGIEARSETVMSGEYPIWAYQHSYTKGEPEGLTKEFITYLLSDEVQEGIIVDQGYIPASKMQVERDAEGNQTNL